MEKYSGAEIESPHAGGAGSYFLAVIVPYRISGEMMDYVDSEEDLDLQTNPSEIRDELVRGVLKNPTTDKTGYEDPEEETRYTDAKQSEILIAYIPVLKYDSPIGNPFFLPPEEIEYVSDVLKLRDMEQEVAGMAEA